MGVALAGVITMAMPIAIGGWLGRRLRRDGRSIRPAVHYLTRSGSFYFGILLMATAVARPLGAALFLALLVVAVLAVVRTLAELPGVTKGLPGTYRRLGDPAAWRGSR